MTTGCLVILDVCICPSKCSDFNSSLSFIILDSLEPETESGTQRLGNNLNQQCEKLMPAYDYLMLDVYRSGLCCGSLTFCIYPKYLTHAEQPQVAFIKLTFTLSLVEKK